MAKEFLKKKISIFHYVQGDSIAHRCDARIKFLIMIALAVASFLVMQPLQLLILGGILLLLCCIAKVNPLSLIYSVRFVLLGLLIITALNLLIVQTGSELWKFSILRITDEGLMRASIYGGRLTCLLMAGALLLACTSPIQLTDGIGKLFSPLQKLGVPVSQLAFVLALAIRYVPILVDETTTIVTAQKCRGAHISHGTFAQRSKTIVSLVVPVVMASVRHAENLGLALLSKNYIPGASRTEWTYQDFLRRKNKEQ